LPSAVMAKVSGQCGNCHTMHNSQDGISVTTTGSPNGVLLNTGCIGCHTGTNSGTSTVPYVLDATGVPATTSLAGGNFYWVANIADNTGHNVSGVASQDGVLGNTPPGGTGALTSQLTCGGTMGCHGNQAISDEFGAIAGGHHGSGGSTLTADSTKHFTSGSTTDMSDAYRMLAGVIGIEDDDWEYTTASASDHNQYYGVARTTETDTAAGSVSNLCASCHGTFHNGAGNVGATGFNSPWVRHPTDFDMAEATGTEYAYYNGGDGVNAAPYSTAAPVASTIVNAGASTLAPLGTVNVTAVTADATAIVTCLSCHRAHGSANADLLRWDYTTMDAHAGTNTNTGCFICHTTKDDI